MTDLTPEQRAEACEAMFRANHHPLAEKSSTEARKLDAALDAAYPIIRRAVLAEAARAAKQWWHKPECERPDIAIRALGDET